MLCPQQPVSPPQEFRNLIMQNGHRCSNPHCVVEFGSDQEHCLFDRECSFEGTQLFQVDQEEVHMCAIVLDVPALFCAFETGAFSRSYCKTFHLGPIE